MVKTLTLTIALCTTTLSWACGAPEIAYANVYPYASSSVKTIKTRMSVCGKTTPRPMACAIKKPQRGDGGVYTATCHTDPTTTPYKDTNAFCNDVDGVFHCTLDRVIK